MTSLRDLNKELVDKKREIVKLRKRIKKLILFEDQKITEETRMKQLQSAPLLKNLMRLCPEVDVEKVIWHINFSSFSKEDGQNLINCELFDNIIQSVNRHPHLHAILSSTYTCYFKLNE